MVHQEPSEQVAQPTARLTQLPTLTALRVSRCGARPARRGIQRIVTSRVAGQSQRQYHSKNEGQCSTVRWCRREEGVDCPSTSRACRNTRVPGGGKRDNRSVQKSLQVPAAQSLCRCNGMLCTAGHVRHNDLTALLTTDDDDDDDDDDTDHARRDGDDDVRDDGRGAGSAAVSGRLGALRRKRGTLSLQFTSMTASVPDDVVRVRGCHVCVVVGACVVLVVFLWCCVWCLCCVSTSACACPGLWHG